MAAQGVGYRYATHNYASQLNLVGWVKNRHDGKVEVVAEGDIPVIIGYAVFIVCIMAGLARHIIDVIAALLLNNITRLAPSVCALEICIFNDYGYKTTLEQLLTWLKQGSRFANVSDVKVTLLPATGEFIDFSIR